MENSNVDGTTTATTKPAAPATPAPAATNSMMSHLTSKKTLITASVVTASALAFAHFTKNTKFHGKYVKLGLIGLATGVVVGLAVNHFTTKK